MTNSFHVNMTDTYCLLLWSFTFNFTIKDLAISTLVKALTPLESIYATYNFITACFSISYMIRDINIYNFISFVLLKKGHVEIRQFDL